MAHIIGFSLEFMHNFLMPLAYKKMILQIAKSR